MTTTGTIYNRTSGPLVINEEGRQLAGFEHLSGVDLDAEPVASHIAAERLIATPDAASEADVDDPAPRGRRNH